MLFFCKFEVSKNKIMKTKLSVQFILIALFFGLSACKTTKTVLKEHQKFLPSEISNLYLGMSLDDF